jgi:hypothetical protein
MKKCTGCGEEKPATLEYFYKRTDTSLCSRCKLCRRANYEANKESIAERTKAYYEANKEAILEQKKAYYREANKESIAERNKAHFEANKEDAAEYQKAYYEANREAILEQRKAYYEANKESIAERTKAYYETNKEAIVEQQKTYQEANKEAIAAYREANKESIAERNKAHYRTPKGRYTQIKARAKNREKKFSLPFELYENQLWGKPCHYCGCEIELTGLDRKDNDRGYTPDNVVPCCINCNSKKGTKPYEVFLEECLTEIYK